jgi:hypothetical protein
MDYSQPGFEKLRETALTGKLNGTWIIAPPNWAIGANVFGTLVTLNAKPESNDFRVIGANLRIGYLPPNGFLGLRAPWRLTLMAGVYYTTTLSSNGNFGYKNVAGPQLFPVLHRALRNGGIWSAYLKFSPISDGLSFLSLSNSELAAGLTLRPWSTRVSGVNFTLDASLLTLQTRVGAVKSNSVSLGLGYSL